MSKMVITLQVSKNGEIDIDIVGETSAKALTLAYTSAIKSIMVQVDHKSRKNLFHECMANIYEELV